MKNVILTFSILLVYTMQAQENISNYSGTATTIDSTIKNLYAVISGEKGEERDWDLFKYLFHPEAKLIPSGKNQNGEMNANFITPEDYISSSGKWLIENGFFEKEIHRKTDRFGNIAHVFTTYHAFKSEADKDPFMRGINSIQLFNDGERWWILNIYWTQESDVNPIPEEYLPKN